MEWIKQILCLCVCIYEREFIFFESRYNKNDSFKILSIQLNSTTKKKQKKNISKPVKNLSNQKILNNTNTSLSVIIIIKGIFLFKQNKI